MKCEPNEIRRAGGKVTWRCEACGFVGTDIEAHFPDRIHRPCRGAKEEPKTPGPGTHLERLLEAPARLLRWFAGSGCGGMCHEHAREMDRWGADKCEENLPTILGWLREGAAAQSVPFVESIARRLIALAIRRARRDREAGEKPG